MDNVKIYEIKRNASKNAKKLFSENEKYYYWNDKEFKKLNKGDIVFFVNKTGKFVLCASVDEKEIGVRIEEDKTSFVDRGKEYVVSGKYDKFIRFLIIENKLIDNSFDYKSLGVPESTYIYGDKVTTIDNNITRVQQLINIFNEKKSKQYLNDSFEYLNKKLHNDDVNSFYDNLIKFIEQSRTNNLKTTGYVKKYMECDVKTSFGAGNKARIPWIAFLSDNNKVQNGIYPVFLLYKNINKLVLAYGISETNQPDFSWGKIDAETIKEYIAREHNLQPERYGDSLIYKIYDLNNLKKSQIDHDLKNIIKIYKKIKPIDMLNSKIIKDINNYIASKGFYFTPKDIANFYLALKTKPFVILAGISGTGKTQLARKFADAINAESELIPVKPDWTDNSDLIGYTDLQNNFQEEKIVHLIKEAIKNPDKIYFAILDEMNLARVEHYFSDFLSIIETRDKDGDKIKTDKLIDKKTLDKIKNKEDLKDLYIPDNFYIIGTVNMDETTHPFSRKVLDRANSIELNEVKLDWSSEVVKDIEVVDDISNDFLETKYINSKDLSTDDKKHLEKVIKKLKELNEILKSADLHFGYRVRDEVSFYMLLQQDIEDILNYEEALDYQIMQKILPRIQGSSCRVKDVMARLVKNLSGKENINPDMDYKELEKNIGTPKKYKKSVNKLLFMLRRFEDDGFTSFWL